MKVIIPVSYIVLCAIYAPTVSVSGFVTVRGVTSQMPQSVSLGLPRSSSLGSVSAASVVEATTNILVKPVMQAIYSATCSIVRSIARLDLLQKVVVLFIFGLGFLLGRFPRVVFPTISEVPDRCFGPKSRLLRGKAVKISDGDTIRLYHTPFPWTRVPKKVKVTKQALAIRLCTIDTPEIAHFGKPAQKFGMEAKQALEEFCAERKRVKVRLLSKDQYGRAVAQLMVGRKHADEFMLKRGLAEVYQGGGAVYGPKGKEAYLAMQAEAQKQKIGIWSQASPELASEYKRRTK